MKRTVKTIVSITLSLALLMGLGAYAFAQPTAAEGPAADDAAEITVSGTASVWLKPDKASISFGVTTQAETADEAQEKNGEAVRDVMEVLTGRGVAEKSIRTTGYNLYPQYDYSEGSGQRILGYTVCTSMRIQDQDIEDVGKLLADCVAAGINQVDQIQFLCSGYEAAYHEALSAAVENARLKAEVLAKAAGRTLGTVVAVTEGWQDSSAKYSRSANLSFAMAADSALGPAFQPGESEISANVTVKFQMN